MILSERDFVHCLGTMGHKRKTCDAHKLQSKGQPASWVVGEGNRNASSTRGEEKGKKVGDFV